MLKSQNYIPGMKSLYYQEFNPYRAKAKYQRRNKVGRINIDLDVRRKAYSPSRNYLLVNLNQ